MLKSLFIDASPLIFLTKAGQLDLLQQIAADTDVVIPVAVDIEIQQYVNNWGQSKINCTTNKRR